MRLEITPDTLLIHLTPWERFWSFKRRNPIEVPLRCIGAITNDEPSSSWLEVRAPGTMLPGVIKAGTYYTSNGRTFWHARANQPYLVLDLLGHEYKRIVLTTPDALLLTEAVRDAISTWRSAIAAGSRASADVGATPI